MLRSVRLGTLSFVLASGLVGCSSSSQSGAPNPADAQAIGCNGDSRAQTYSADMGQAGTGGVFRFILADANPAPTSTGTEIWTLKVVDASGSPVIGATFPVMKPWMPEHKHGTSTVTVTSNHDGTYTLNPMYLFMAGLWEIDITAESGTKKDSTSFYFCL
jgi:hypothetical protein